MSGMQRNERIERKKKDLVVIGGGPAGLEIGRAHV